MIDVSRLWDALGEFDDVDRAKEKIETIYSDEQYPWPPGRAPWCAEAGGTGVVPDSARRNVRHRRMNYLSNDFQIAREQKVLEEVARHREENDNNLGNIDPTLIGEIASQEELSSYTRVLDGILGKIQSHHAEELFGGSDNGEAAAREYLLSSVSRIVRDINAVPVVTPPSRDEMIAAAILKAAPAAARVKREEGIPTFTTAVAPPAAAAGPQSPIAEVDSSIVEFPAPPPQDAPAPVHPVSSPLAPTFPMPVPSSVNPEQSAPRRTVINLELYKKKKRRVAPSTETIPCDLTVPPPGLPPTIMDMTSEVESFSRRDPRLRKK